MIDRVYSTYKTNWHICSTVGLCLVNGGGPGVDAGVLGGGEERTGPGRDLSPKREWGSLDPPGSDHEKPANAPWGVHVVPPGNETHECGLPEEGRIGFILWGYPKTPQGAFADIS